MKITYLGHSCFLIEGKEKSVVTDPFADIGYEMKKVTADYCTISHEHFDHNNESGVSIKKAIRNYTDGFLAIDSYHDSNLGAKRGKNTIFKFVIDGLTFCHLGDLGEYFSQDLVDEIGSVDVLFIPVGGTYTIDAKEAVKFATAIKAPVTIPMHFRTPSSNIDISEIRDFTKRIAGVELVGNTVEIEDYINNDENAVLVFDYSEF